MDIVTLAAARKSGGSGGDVTKQYVDDHLALKADKSETEQYPIADSVSGDAVSVTDSADGYVQGLEVYGRSRISKNIFNKSNIMLNKHVSSTAGNTYTVDGFTVANFIDVTPGSTYVISGHTGGSFAEYTDSTFYTGRSWAENTPITVSNNTNRIRFDFPTTSLDQIQLELGSEPTPYEPYGIISIGDGGSLTITTANSDSAESSTATLTTGLPLCGVPVNSGETYTDEQGQKWLADTASVEGVVKRCYKVTFDGSETWTEISNSYREITNSNEFSCTAEFPTKHHDNNTIPNAIATITIDTPSRLYYQPNTAITIGDNANDDFVGIRIANVTTTVELQTYLTSNPVTIIYEHATPTTQELTSTEMSALTALETYSGTTNIAITDSPTMTVDYLRDTENGHAAADMQVNILNATKPWNNAGAHNAIYRGKYLGSSVIDDQWAMIDAGTFDDLFIGDYWTIGSVNYRIAALDYYLGTGKYGNTHQCVKKHHAVIVPDTTLYNAVMNDSATTEGGYVGSKMYTTNLATALSTVETAFGSGHILERPEYLCNAVTNGKPSGCAWTSIKVVLMTEMNVCGTKLWAPMSDGSTVSHNGTVDMTQFPLFAYGFNKKATDNTYWLRDVVKGNAFSLMDIDGAILALAANTNTGVRPSFSIYAG